MKRNFTYIVFLVLFCGATAFVIFRYNGALKNKTIAFYPLQERKGVLSQGVEWASTKTLASNLIRSIREKPNDIKTALALSTLYIQEARVTGDYSYYNTAAMKYIDDVLIKEPDHLEALKLKALLLVSQHHFAEGLAVAERARQISPYYAFVHGILIDGYVEMGNYTAAVENAEKMISLRPDIRSYSRISYLREIHGDYPGAIEAMKMAVDAGIYGDEPTAWARIQLARLYENTGDMPNAEMHYTIALDQRPGYAYAIAGLGRIALWKEDYTKAISLFKQANGLIKDNYFKEQLVQAYLASGNEKKATEVLNKIVEDITASVKETAEDENAAHHADAELAHVFLLLKDFDKALIHAGNEYNRRPDNIDVNALMACIYYKKGEVAKSLPFIKNALSTNSKNPTLLCQAGLIYYKTGDREKAKILLTEALLKNPNIDSDLKEECKTILQTI